MSLLGVARAKFQALACLAVLFALFSAPPAWAHGEQVACNAESAFWGYQAPDVPPNATQLETPTGAVTTAWECRVGAHTITVRSGREVRAPSGQCGACDLGLVSVWVDRRRLLEEPIGDGDIHRTTILTSVTLQRDRVVICYGPGMYADEDETRSCETRRLRRWRAPVDTGFVPVEERAPFAFDLSVAADAQCEAATAELAMPPAIRAASSREQPEDPSFGALHVAIQWSPTDWPDVYGSREARFDVDNDGVEDVVTVQRQMMHGDEAPYETLSWRGASGATNVAPMITREGLVTLGVYGSRQLYQPLRWGGRVVLYVREQAFDVDDGEEAEAAQFVRTFGRAPPTRALIELHPNGSATLLCAWSPRPRAEDRL
ncbi:MAG: hypothetical protein NT015_06135 [Alphaproteobacteria bacterium]|nr:hypothetical protein [Alphaproteobacteria bacterium]